MTFGTEPVAEAPTARCSPATCSSPGSIGRTDLPGGDHAKMLRSLARTPHPARRHAGAARPRPADHDRRRARVQSLPDRSVPASPEGAVRRHDIPGAQGRLRVPAAPRRAVREVRDAFTESARRACYADVERRFSRTPRCSSAASANPRRGPQGDVHVQRSGDREITLRPEFTAGVLRAVSSTTCTRARCRSRSSPAAPRSATSAPRPAGTGNSTSSTWRRSAPRTRRLTPRRSRSPGTRTRLSGCSSTHCC